MSYIDSLKFYIEFKVKKSVDFSENVILATLFKKMHISMVDTKINCGLSFPEYNLKGLGSILRIHGTKENLLAILDNISIKSLSEHLEVSPVLQIPDKYSMCIFKRLQVRGKSALRRNCARLLKRDANADINAYTEKIHQKRVNLPYLLYRSDSTKQSFSFFIKKESITNSSLELDSPSFSCYGLSILDSYVPVF